MTERIDTCDIRLCTLKQHNINYAIIANTSIDFINTEKLEAAMQAFIYFHIAIRPVSDVVLFCVDSLHNAGTIAYAGNPETPAVYHIPQTQYQYLDECVTDEFYIVSMNYLENIVKNRKANGSIFNDLNKQYQEHGLVVIGIHETQET